MWYNAAMNTFIPNRTEDNCLQLPQGIDFRRPGQLSPQDAQNHRERCNKMNNIFGGLHQNPYINGQAGQQISNAALTMLGLRW